MTPTPLSLFQTLSGAAPGGLGAQLGVSVAAVAVVAGAVGAAMWIGRRVRAEAERGTREGASPTSDGPSELTSRHVFRVLQERKIASVEEIAAMSPRERQLLFDAVARKVTPIVGVPAVAASGGGARGAAPAATDAPIGVLHCPACSAAVPSAEDAARVLVTCGGCGRRLSARRDGARVSVTVDDPRGGASGAVPARRPQRPSGGSPTTRGRS